MRDLKSSSRYHWASEVVLVVKNLPSNAGDMSCGTELQRVGHDWACMEQLPPKNDFVVLSASWSSDLTLFPGGSDHKESTCRVGDLGLIPVLGRSPGAGHGNPLLYSCLKNPPGQRSPVGYSPWGYKESDMTDQLSAHRRLHQMINLRDEFSWRCYLAAKITIEISL